MWMDFFSLKKASFATMVGCLALMVLLWLRNRKEFPKICIAWKKYLPLLLLLVAFAFVSGEKSGLYPSGQDEGLYQMRAALYIGGYNNSNVVQFPEYEFILNDWEKQVYRERLEEMEGYYLLREDGVEGDVARFVLLHDCGFQVAGVSHCGCDAQSRQVDARGKPDEFG